MAKQIEIEMQKANYTNLVLAERTTFKKLITKYADEVLPTMCGGKADHISLKALIRHPTAKAHRMAATFIQG